MAAPSMVSKSGDTLVVRSVVSGNTLYGTEPVPTQENHDNFNTNEEDDQPVDGDGDEGDGDNLPQCKIKRNYTCTSCDYFTQNPRYYLYHMKDVHFARIRIYECPKCLYASKHSQKLQRHIHMVHVMGAKKRKIAKVRLRSARSRPQLPPSSEKVADVEATVSASQSVGGMYKCLVCGVSSPSSSYIARHEKLVHQKRRLFRCTKCDYTTHIRARFTKHVKYHSMPMIKCDICDFKTPYKWNLDRHNKNHTGDGVFKCSVCNFRADIKQSLTVHEIHHHVPPVGGFAVGVTGGGARNRRYKVGASDIHNSAPVGSDSPQDGPELSGMQENSSNESSAHPQTACSLNTNSGAEDTRSPRVLTPEEIMSKHLSGYKCHKCDYSTDTQMLLNKHLVTAHGKKPPRPIPNLIPIQPNVPNQGKPPTSPTKPLSEQVINEICAKSLKNNSSSLKDFASLIGDEDTFKNSENSNGSKSSGKRTPSPSGSEPPHKKRGNGSSFFDKLKEQVAEGGSDKDMKCSVCGYEATTLSEYLKHKGSHAADGNPVSNGTSSAAELSSTRCQHCRQRCKTSGALLAHLLECTAARNPEYPVNGEAEDAVSNKLGELNQHFENEVHPMENRVFVWNKIEPQQVPQQPAGEVQGPASGLIGIEVKPGYGTSADPVKVKESLPPEVLSTRRVYKCPQCNFWASTASRFHVHIVGHLNKRPFQCSLCHYSSNWRWDITKHIRLKSSRDPEHEGAKVLLTDEAGKRNYSKYNKYLTLMRLKYATPYGMSKLRNILPKQGEGMLKQGHDETGQMFVRISDEEHDEGEPHFEDPGIPAPRKPSQPYNMKKMWKCKKCHFRNTNRDVVLAHVKDHYRVGVVKKSPDADANKRSPSTNPQTSKPEPDLTECPDYMCETCPFIAQTFEELERHSEKHFVMQRTCHKCNFCPFYTPDQQDLADHLELHKSTKGDHGSKSGERPNVVFACLLCPYIALSKAQLAYHRKWHNSTIPTDHKCPKCTYSAPNNTFLSLHMRLHRRSNTEAAELAKKKEEPTTLVDISDVLTTDFPDIPLVWVSKNERISKLFKCRHCPFVNMRKNNIQEHEKMHITRPRSPSSASVLAGSCPHCNFVCNNSALLSSHVRVHQGSMGIICMIADGLKTDEQQIAEVKERLEKINMPVSSAEESADPSEVKTESDDIKTIFFCEGCPARFYSAQELNIHSKFHYLQLYFRCTLCSYSARERQHMWVHEKVHTDEYQERTKIILESARVSEERPQLSTLYVNDESHPGWVVVQDPSQKAVCDKCPAQFATQDSLNYHRTLHGGVSHFKCKICDYAANTAESLGRHEGLHGQAPPPKPKLEKEELKPKQPKSPELTVDAEFGTLIHGSPEFVYPTCMKHGKLKAKKYKCPKCPSAFEKREQYKIHLSLHGSRQKYACKRCDYAVKYVANYAQHMKKHEFSDAQKRKERAAVFGVAAGEEEPMEEDKDPKDTRSTSPPKSIKMTSVEQQELLLAKYKSPSIVQLPLPQEPVSRCPYCPYANNRKDGCTSHLKCHSNLRPGGHSCRYCDYSVPHQHFLREHVKYHFSPIKYLKPEGYMKCDKLELWAEPADSKDASDKWLVFKDKGPNGVSDNRFLPKVHNLPDFTNIKGRVYINLKTGEEEIEHDDEDEVASLGDKSVNNNNHLESQKESVEEDDKDKPNDLGCAKSWSSENLRRGSSPGIGSTTPFPAHRRQSVH